MATTYVRHQLHLHRPQIGGRGWLLLVTTMLLAGPALAQRKRSDDIDRGRNGHVKGITVDNLPNYNRRFFRPGLYIAPNFSRFFIEQSAAYVQALQQGRGITANSIISPGLALGFIGDIRLGPPETPLHLRFTPGLSFLTRRVEYQGRGVGMPDTIRNQEVNTTQLELPLLLKYQSNRRRNTRVYAVAGLKYSYAFRQSLDVPASNQVRVSNSDLLLEYGVGLDLFYPYFKFGPELRFSHGLRNVLTPSQKTQYATLLQSLKTNTVTLILNIE
ncbi:MAG: PorT family protein [Hymenobacter sp.]|nr:MAG: PorT family protein [Hymenobacter sp.]